MQNETKALGTEPQQNVQLEVKTTDAANEERKINANMPKSYSSLYAAIYRAHVILMLAIGVMAFFSKWLAITIMTVLNVIWNLSFSLTMFTPPKDYSAPSKVDQAHVDTKEQNSTMTHIVLTSHYQEERWLLERLLDSVQSNLEHATFPVHVVIAAERSSNFIKENWSSLSAKYKFPIHIAVHDLEPKTERAGLGSNLRNAVEFILRQSTLPVEDTMITKIDGNCVLSDDFLRAVEVEWAKDNWSVGTIFQPLCTEVDPNYEEYEHLSLLMKGANCIPSTQTLGTHILKNSHVHCAFCIPFETLLQSGSWDPILIQEDCLIPIRATIGCDYKLNVRLLRSNVYSAPALTWKDYWLQQERCMVNALIATAMFIANMHRLRWFQTPTLINYIIYTSLGFHLYLSISTLIAVLLSIAQLPTWLLLTNLALGLSLSLLAPYVLRTEKTIPGFIKAFFVTNCGLYFRSFVLFVSLIKGCFLSHSSMKYHTTGTMKKSEKP